MKKIVLLAVVLLSACQRAMPTTPLFGERDAAECEAAWYQARPLGIGEEDNEGFVDLAINKEHAPDSVGAAIKDCVLGGWTYWREAPVPLSVCPEVWEVVRGSSNALPNFARLSVENYKFIASIYYFLDPEDWRVIAFCKQLGWQPEGG